MFTKSVAATWKISTFPVDAPVSKEAYSVEAAVWAWVESLGVRGDQSDPFKVEYVDTYATAEGYVVTRFRVKFPHQDPRLVDVTLENAPSDVDPFP